MSDESFRLTPLDIRRWPFESALRGYDKAGVDAFRDQVAAEVERLVRANNELEQKAKGFHEQLRAFRERDKAINDALISAQQLRGEIQGQAERESQLLLREAQAEAERIVEHVRAEARRVEDALVQIDRSKRAFLAQLRVMYERQIAEISAAETESPALLGFAGGSE